MKIAVLVLLSWAAFGATVRVQVIDDADRQTVAARAYLWRGNELIVPAGFSSYVRGEERHFLVTGDFLLDLAPGSYRLRMERGLEYEPAEVSLEVQNDATVPVRLHRWIDMKAKGWYSSDMHVHRDPAEVPLILRAEDLNFVPTITNHVWSDDERRPWKAPREFPVAVEPGRIFTGNSQEVERIQGGGGAILIMAPGMRAPFRGYELYPPTISFTRKAHQLGGFIEADKPFWMDTFALAALKEMDAIEVNCNHFLPKKVDTDLIRWSHWPVEFGYRGNRGFLLWVMELYYRMLNSGIELPLSAGSANGVKETPVGYNRVYVQLGKQAFTYDSLLQALRAGRSFSTNGPIVEMEVDGRYGPGDHVAIQREQEVRFRARARSLGPIESLQLIVNGKVAAEQKATAGEVTLEKTLRLERSSWAAVRVFEKSGRSEVFAHTSPVYLVLNGKPVVVEESVRDLLGKMDVLIRHTEREQGFREERHRQENLDVYRAARAVLAGRLGSR